MSRKFTKINNEFICVQCKSLVPKSEKSCRNHCPNCLYSLHVDIFPGDRANLCKGLLKPVGYEISGKKGIIIIFTCIKCGDKVRNKTTSEEETVRDDLDRILALTENYPK